MSSHPTSSLPASPDSFKEPKPNTHTQDKKDRLAAALRQNLLRRKAKAVNTPDSSTTA